MELAKTNRNISIDVLRILACALVVLHHTKIDSSNSILHLLYAASFTITRCAVPLFFMISGYLLISQSGDAMSFLKKRFDRIIVPLLVWLLVYNLFFVISGGVTNWKDFLFSFFSLEAAPHLWFLYALIGVYLLIPIVSPFLQKVTFRGFLFYMLIWGVTLIFNGNNFAFLWVFRLFAIGLYRKSQMGLYQPEPMENIIGYFIGRSCVQIGHTFVVE